MSAVVPKGYKQTKVGVIPEDWDVVKLGDIGEVISGLTYSPNDIDETGLLVLRSSNIKDRKLSFRDNVYVNVSKLKFNPVMENDLLICVRNGSKSLIGKNALIDKRSGGVAFGAFMSIFRSQYYPFLYQLFDTDIYKREVHKNLGATINSINGSDLKKFRIPFPSLREQQKIAEILSTWDDAIAKQEALIAQKERYKKGLMQKLLSGEVRVAGFSGEWDSVALEKIGTFSKGKGISKSEVVSKGLPCIRYGEIYTSYNIVIDKFKSFIDAQTAASSQKIQRNDILFASSGETNEDIGKSVTFVDEQEAYAGGDIIIFTPKENIDSVALTYFLNHIDCRREISKLGQGQSVVHIYPNGLRRVKIKLPSVPEQQKIAEVLSFADNEVEALKNELQILREQKKGLMQQLLTGKIRVTKCV